MVEVNVHGISLNISDDKLDDWELLELLREYDKGNGGLIVDIMVSILGDKQYASLKSAIKAEEGRISSKSMMVAFTTIMEAAQNLKN